MESNTLHTVAKQAVNELDAADWEPKSSELVRDEVWLIPASKGDVSLLFQFNVRRSIDPRMQPCVGMHRDPAMKRSGAKDFVPPADIPINEDGSITSEGLANIKLAISQANDMLKVRNLPKS